jgi:colanic acid/amylovoran biosynthesis glycosyltransferase
MEERVESQIDWLGPLPFAEFTRRVASSSLALFPSRSARDGDSEGGAPVALIDAQWLGVPAVVSDHDDLPFVTAPSGGVVCPATAVDAWADAILFLYEMPEALEAMSVAAAAFARSHHSPEANVLEREAVYDDVIGSG